MGTLYWQLNDCWPVTSWSSVDYYGRWKALQYFVKKAYNKYLVSFEENEDGLDVFFVSDDTSAFEAEVKWKLIDFNGKNIFDDKHEISIDKNSSTVIKIFNGSELQKWEPLDNKILIVEVFNSKEKPASAVKIFTKAKNLKLHTNKPEFEISKTKDAYLLTFKSKSLIKGLQISCSEDGFFSDNYFDLLPGEETKITFKTNSTSLKKDDFSFIYLGRLQH
jgi:beta-mannosidase